MGKITAVLTFTESIPIQSQPRWQTLLLSKGWHMFFLSWTRFPPCSHLRMVRRQKNWTKRSSQGPWTFWGEVELHGSFSTSTWLATEWPDTGLKVFVFYLWEISSWVERLAHGCLLCVGRQQPISWETEHNKKWEDLCVLILPHESWAGIPVAFCFQRFRLRATPSASLQVWALTLHHCPTLAPCGQQALRLAEARLLSLNMRFSRLRGAPW